MTKHYRVLIKQTEYRNLYVEAENSLEARRKVEDGNWFDSEFLSAENTEVIEVTP